VDGDGAGGQKGKADGGAAAKKKGPLREALGKLWRDPTLDEWPDNDFRIFVGDLGNDTNDDALAKAFQKYPSLAKAKVRAREWGSCVHGGFKEAPVPAATREVLLTSSIG
jgi:hypothetical protein